MKDRKKKVETTCRQCLGLSPAEILTLASKQHGGRIALASSLGAEDQVLTDIICRAGLAIPVFTLDTGRLPEETYEVIEATRLKYGITIEILFPDRQDVEPIVSQHGVNLFYGSVEHRKLCCHVRKVIPLQHKLAHLDAWVTGLRRQQAPTRVDLDSVEWDHANSLVKFNPLIEWTTQQVWDYMRQNGVPYNKLHDHGYPSIGCAPCTRAVSHGQDIRDGRWWWEQPRQKECGLHLQDGKLVRAKGTAISDETKG